MATQGRPFCRDASNPRVGQAETEAEAEASASWMDEYLTSHLAFCRIAVKLIRPNNGTG